MLLVEYIKKRVEELDGLMTFKEDDCFFLKRQDNLSTVYYYKGIWGVHEYVGGYFPGTVYMNKECAYIIANDLNKRGISCQSHI